MNISASVPEVVSATPLAPWGSPPTPLLPRGFIESFSSAALPSAFLQAVGAPPAARSDLGVVGDLMTFWDRRPTPISNAAQAALADLAVSSYPGSFKGQIVIPADSTPQQLSELPLRTRTRNCILRGFNQKRLKPGEPLTVVQLLALPNFGVLSLLDLMCVIEAAQIVGLFKSLPAADRQTVSFTGQDVRWDQTQIALATQLPSDLGRTKQYKRWETAIPLLERILNVAGEFCGARTLGDALNIDLSNLAAKLELTDEFHEIRISDLVKVQSLADQVLKAIDELWEGLRHEEKLTLERRIMSPSRVSYRELGQMLDLSGERVRQMTKSLTRSFESKIGSNLEIMASLLREQIPPILSENELEEHISSIFSDPVVGEYSAKSQDLACCFLQERLGFSPLEGLCLNEAALDVLDVLRRESRNLADDAGLVQESALREHLPSASWEQYWDLLVSLCDFHRLGGFLALRNSRRARAKAALLEIGRPATRDEIAELCGLDPGRVVSHLSVLESVVRADKVRWGLVEWIEDEYEGIAAEIIQRIHEDNGATRLERILEELPRQFGVSEFSVRSFVGTPRFVLRDGLVSLADTSSIVLRPLSDVLHGYTAAGFPYWCFEVEDRFFKGYSVPGFPPEIAAALGCEPDGNIRVQVSSPPGCRRLSVNWPLASVGGLSLGYVSEPLQQLGACAGDRVRVIIEGSDSVSLQIDKADDSSDDRGRVSSTSNKDNPRDWV